MTSKTVAIPKLGLQEARRKATELVAGISHRRGGQQALHHVHSSSKKATRHNSSRSPSVCSGINYIPFPGNRNPCAASYIITLSGGSMHVTYQERLGNKASTHAQTPYVHSQTWILQFPSPRFLLP